MATFDKMQVEETNIGSLTLTTGTNLQYGVVFPPVSVDATAAATTVLYTFPSTTTSDGVKITEWDFQIEGATGTPTGTLTINIGTNNAGGNNNMIPSTALTGLNTNFESFTYRESLTVRAFAGDVVRFQITGVLSSGNVVITPRGIR